MWVHFYNLRSLLSSSSVFPKYERFQNLILNIKNSETCYQGQEPNQVRFVCPRQNEPREFLYCCKINGNDTNLVR